jgi:hypothetical protein
VVVHEGDDVLTAMVLISVYRFELVTSNDILKAELKMLTFRQVSMEVPTRTSYKLVDESGQFHQEKKNMPTIFRLGARAIGTCLELLAATWQSIGKWGN